MTGTVDREIGWRYGIDHQLQAAVFLSGYVGPTDQSGAGMEGDQGMPGRDYIIKKTSNLKINIYERVSSF